MVADYVEPIREVQWPSYVPSIISSFRPWDASSWTVSQVSVITAWESRGAPFRCPTLQAHSSAVWRARPTVFSACQASDSNASGDLSCGR